MTNKTVQTESSINLFSAGLILTAFLAIFKVTGIFPSLTLFQIMLPVILAFAVWVILLVIAIVIVALVAFIGAIIAMMEK
jgi:uncharacterized membrane protein YdbT with pleckstrin-like domain